MEPMSLSQQQEYSFSVLLNEVSRTLFFALAIDPRHTRFLRFNHHGGSLFKLVWGGFNEEGVPVVCFTDGSSLLQCLRLLGSALERKKWTEDKFADENAFDWGARLLAEKPFWVMPSGA